MDSTGRLALAPLPADPPLSVLRGRRYGEDRLYLLVRDPRCVLILWELTAETHARAVAASRPPRYQIRIDRRADPRAAVEAIATVDLPDALGGDRWYVTLPKPGGEIGRAHV